jgi:hypothetical protein
MSGNGFQLGLDRPDTLIGGSRDYTEGDIQWVVSQFEVDGPVRIAPFPGRGNINLHTYEVEAEKGQFLLQKVNSDVFTMPYRVMTAMVGCLEAQERALAEGYAVEGWEPIRLVPTRQGLPFLDLTDEHGWSVWRLMVRIQDSVSYKSLGEVPSRADQLRLAEEVGRGLAIYGDLTTGMETEGIDGSLPGYRDTGLYYRQLHSILAGNRTLGEAAPLLPDEPILRAATERHFLVALSEPEFERRKSDPELVPFLNLVLEQEPFAMGLWRALGEGRIRRTLIHGDTKIENFLFCARTGRVKSLVDLDTIMPFTWLADWGDMVRSMVNVAGERERDRSKIRVDLDVYEAVARGFLAAAREVTDQEVAMMSPAVEAITLELGLRFLTDYLRGDTYFQLGPNDPADLNKIRALAQLELYRKLVESAPEIRSRTASLRSAAKLA